MGHVPPPFLLTDCAVSRVNAQQSGAIPDPRSQTDRRQCDGLGLLPRAKTLEEREARHRANLLIGWWLIALGLVMTLSGLRNLIRTRDFTAGVLVLLGIFVLAQGVQLVRRKERRKANRRVQR